MDHATAIRRLYDLINAGDIDGFGHQLADDVAEREDLPGFPPTRAGVIQYIRRSRSKVWRTGNLDVDWSRWYRNAIDKSAKQLWGAERHIRAHPARIFIDPKCGIRLPIPLPHPDKMRIHRVVVAHGAAQRCREALGGSGSLMIVPGIIGDDHQVSREKADSAARRGRRSARPNPPDQEVDGL